MTRYPQLELLLRDGSLDEVKAFVKEHPDSVTEKGGESEGVAIHYAVGDQMTNDEVTLGKVAFLLTANPLGVTEKDRSGRLPLHNLADQSTFRPEFLRLLLNSFPGATKISNIYLDFPVHLALSYKNYDTAMILLREHVGGLDCLNKHMGELVCHENHLRRCRGPLLPFALLCMAPTEFIRLLMQRAPEFIKLKDRNGDLPLGIAVQQDIPLDQVQLLLDAYPDALQVPNEDKDLPIHLAARCGYRHEVLRLLMDGYPEGVYVKNSDGRLPFFCAMENNSITMDCLNLLYERYPLDLTLRDERGNTPLGMACVRGTKTNVEWIIAKCPENAQIIADLYGNLPVHNVLHALRCDVKILKLLIETFPGSLLEKNKNGYLPLHVSLASLDRSLPVVKFLLKACPKAASQVDCWGQLPLHLIFSRGASDIGLVNLLFKQYPRVAAVHDNCASDIGLVDLLIKHYPRALAVYDNCGHLPFHVALLRGDNLLIRHWITKFHCSTLPWTKEGIPPLVLACQHQHAKLGIIYLLVHQSMELFSGNVRVGHNSRALALADKRLKKCKRKG